MLPVRYHTTPLGLFPRGVDHFFDELLERPSYPALNCWEDEDNFFVEAECPGLAIDDFELSIVGKKLSISGKRATSEDDEGLTFHRRERSLTNFSRVLTLPTDVEVDTVEASLVNGVLTVKLPKAATTRVRQIPISN